MVDLPSTCPVPLDLDECEAAILQLPPAECPVVNGFACGFYVRRIHMPAGSIVASRIHLTRHPYWITKGKVSVHIDGKAVVLEAPFVGITEPGTRRLLFIHEDCEWTTFHDNPNDERDIEKLVDGLTEEHVNAVLGLEHANINDLHRIIHDMKTLELAEMAAGGTP